MMLESTQNKKKESMGQVQTIYTKRSPMDRRSPVDRRILDMGPGYPGADGRIIMKERRKGWEDRYGWERISKWSSSPIYSDLP